MMKLIVISLVITVSLAATTTKRPHHSHASHASHASRPSHAPHTPRPTHEPDVHHSYSFHYDHTSHIVLVRVGKVCYLQALDQQQQVDIHNAQGLVAIEKMLIEKVATAAQTTDVTPDSVAQMSNLFGRICPATKVTIKQFA